ncbi:hypothetical protein ACWGKQ_28640 [Streptomyces sp. NPDC054770]
MAAQRPLAGAVLTSFRTTEDQTLELWVTNSGNRSIDLHLHVEVAAFTGEKIVDTLLTVAAPAYGSRRVWSSPAAEHQPGPNRYAWVSDLLGNTDANRVFFTPLKDLRLPGSRLATRVTALHGGTADITLTSHGYSYLARLLAPAPGVTFSRNYLDLRDGDQARITVGNLPPDFDPERLLAAVYPH